MRIKAVVSSTPRVRLLEPESEMASSTEGVLAAAPNRLWVADITYWSRTAAFASGAARAHAVKESLRQLELALALRDPDLTAWAERDPGLGWVQSARPDAIRRLTARDPSGELAGVRAIGPSLAAKLEADHGIGTAEALAKTTSAERNTSMRQE